MPKEGKQMTDQKKTARAKKMRRAVSISRIMALTFLGIIVWTGMTGCGRSTASNAGSAEKLSGRWAPLTMFMHRCFTER